jgi:succinoglycan biosynthesis protein ExoM
MLKRLLEELERQETGGLFKFSIVITDNDAQESARQVFEDFKVESGLDVTYVVEPRQNIALARNKGLEYAQGEAIAFIDDDEFPSPSWLPQMYNALVAYRPAGVLGPVKPFFNSSPPRWLVKGGFYDRPTHKMGFVMPWSECRTGNVLLYRNILETLPTVFRPEFGAGGEDQDLFHRLIDAGRTFIWCDTAPVFEIVPPHRWKRAYLLRAALLRGYLNMLRPDTKFIPIMKSTLAIPLYGLSLPFLQILGHHVFMKYLVKLCDHTGRLLALMGLNPVRTREI